METIFGWATLVEENLYQVLFHGWQIYLDGEAHLLWKVEV